MSLDAPSKIGKYDVLAVLGRGGMGVVFKANDPLLDRLVAIKMITGVYADDPELLKRFFREAQSTASLQHPNIVTLFELGDHAGNPYMVMEYLEGESLDSIMKSRRPLTLIDKIGLVIAVCQGLSYAHQRAIVHRDIKPANIMILKDGSVKIVDFGIVHIGNQTVTRTGVVLGSPNYMSPEQVSGASVDSRSDLFSTGVVLYQVLTSALPFNGPTTASTLYKIVHEPPAPIKSFSANCPSDLESIVLKALSKEREDRYPSAADFAFDLEQVQQRLKHEAIDQHLQDASLFLDQGNLYPAQERLQLVLTIDRRHARASQLLRDVARRIQQQEAHQEAQKLRVQAEDALAAASFDLALVYVDRAIELESNDAMLLGLRGSIQEARAREQKLRRAIEDAELAHNDGNLESARQAAEKALELAPNDTRAKAVFQMIQLGWAERSRQIELQKYLADARREITARRFTAALDFLKLADALDANAPEVQVLRETAASGQEQESRRREQQAINEEIEDALERGDYATARRKADEGIERFPEEPAFDKLKHLAEKQIQIAERKQFVDAQLALSRTLLDEGRGKEVLAVLESALERIGPEPRIQSLLLIVRDNVGRQRIEQRKTEFITKAKDALREKQNAQAIRLLEEARIELKDAPEIEELLLLAREHSNAEKRRDLVEEAAQKAHDYLARQEYEEAIRLLEATSRETGDDQLTMILAEARRAVGDHQLNLENTLRAAQRMLQAEHAAEALKLLESQSSFLARDPAFRRLLKQAQDESQRFASIQDAIHQSLLASQNNDYQTARRMLEDCKRRFGSAQELERQIAEVATNETAAATQIVQRRMRTASELAERSDFNRALDELALASNLITFVSPSLKSEYQECQHQWQDALAQERKGEIQRRILANDYTSAEALLRETLVQFPRNRDFMEMETVILRETGLHSDAQQALIASEQCFERRDWKQGGEFLQKAYRTVRPLSDLRQKAVARFLGGAESALPDWQAAEMLLKQLAEVQPEYIVPSELQTRIQEQRKESLIVDCLRRAQELQRAGSLHGAAREIAEGISAYPDEKRLLDRQTAIASQIEQAEDRIRLDQIRREREGFVQNAVQRALEETDLERRVRLLEDAAVRYPGDSRLKENLSEARALRERVRAILQEASSLEDAGKYDEALATWNALRAVHALHPELDRGISRISQLVEMTRSAARASAIERIQDALASADYDRAAQLLGEAKGFGKHAEIDDLARRLEECLQARSEAQTYIADGRKAFLKKHWGKGAAYLRRALELAKQDSVVRDQMTSELLRACESAIESDIAAANSLLAQASDLQPALSLLAPLRMRIDQVRRREDVERGLSKAIRREKSGDLTGALQEIDQALRLAPDHDRLLQFRKEIQTQIQDFEDEARRREQLDSGTSRQAEIHGSVPRQAETAISRGQLHTIAKTSTFKWIGASLATVLVIVIALWIRSSGTSKRLLRPSFKVQITTTPVGATVRIRNTDWVCVSPNCNLSLEAGNYEAIAEFPGYTTATQPFSVSSSGTDSVSMSLFEKPARLEAHGLKSAAEILIDGRPQGQVTSNGDFSIELPAGSHEIRWVTNDHTSGSTFRRISPGETVALSANDFNSDGSRDPSESAWQSIHGTNNIPDLEGFLALYPRSTHKAELESSLDNLYWRKAESVNHVEDVEAYLHRFPNGSHRVQAESMREQLYWEIANNSRSPADLQKYLHLFHDGAHFAEVATLLEDLDWQHAREVNTVAAFAEYLGKYRMGHHAAEATQEIDNLEFRQIEISTDAAALEEYLAKHSSGSYHDQVYARLDELTWASTNKQDPLSLHTYVQKFPNGHHIGEANKNIGAVSSQVELQSIKAAIERYRDAYESESPADMKNAWPGISKDRLKKMTELFNTFSAIRMRISCRESDMQIDAHQASAICHQTARFTQRGTVMPEQPSNVKIVLKKLADGSWVIDSISGQ